MSQPKLEVADIFRRHGEAWRAANAGHVSLAQRRVMTAIEICRTAALGGHVERCEDCAHTRIAYNSCRNRHCPKCQWSAAERWLAAREAELLPVPYFHVVFTLPAAIGAIAYQNKAKVYGLLFKAAAETLTTIAADPKHLGRRDRRHRRAAHLGPEPRSSPARPLHRAGRRHLARSATRWVRCRPDFFLPVRVLSRLFRRLFLDGLIALLRRRRAAFFGDLAGLADRARVPRLSRAAAQERMGGLRQAAVRRPGTGARLSCALHASRRHRQQPARRVSTDDHVAFRWKDYRENGRTKQGHAARRRRVHAPVPAPRACPTASTAFATTACSPTAIAPKISRAAARCSARRRASRVTSQQPRPNSSSAPGDPQRCPCCGGRMIVIESFDGVFRSRTRKPAGL